MNSISKSKSITFVGHCQCAQWWDKLFDPENNFAPNFLDSFKSRDYIYKGNIFEPVPPCKPCLCFVHKQLDEDLLPLWLQAKTFLLSLETLRAFLSFRNRNINLDQCQSFFPLGSLFTARYTSVFVFPSENSNLTKTLCLDVEVPVEARCYMCSYCTRAVSSIAVLWGHLLGRCVPAVRHTHHVPNQPKRKTINTCYMRDREQEPKQYFCVLTARLVPHFVPVFLLLRPQIKAALIFNAEHSNWANFKMRCLTITPEPQKVYTHLKPPVSFAARFELQQVKDNF